MLCVLIFLETGSFCYDEIILPIDFEPITNLCDSLQWTSDFTNIFFCCDSHECARLMSRFGQLLPDYTANKTKTTKTRNNQKQVFTINKKKSILRSIRKRTTNIHNLEFSLLKYFNSFVALCFTPSIH